METVVRSILFALLSAGLAHANLLLDDFENIDDWVAEENIDGTGQSTLSLSADAAEGEGALLVTDKAAEKHFYWLTKTCPDGVWDWSNCRHLALWVRGDGQPRQIYVKAVDEQDRQMFWNLGRLKDTAWKRFTIDIVRGESVFRHENPNLARVAKVGIRCDKAQNYTIAFDRMELLDPLSAPEKASTSFTLGRPMGYLAPRSTDDIGDSLIGVNLHPGVGRLTTADIDRLAAAGVKWAARMPLDLESAYATRVRADVLRHKFNVHGQFGVNHLLTGEALSGRLAQIQRTVNALHEEIRVWEIGNEPNIGKFWSDKPDPIEFGQMVVAFAKAIRSADPGATIISGGLVGYDMDFAERMLTTGMGDWVDVIGIHTPRRRPEYARDQAVDHADALARFRGLIESVNPKLVVWQTEVQATPNVTFEEVVGGITDYQQARHVARRFFYEHNLGIPVSFWQLFKAGRHLDHPGALLRVDGTPTLKFCAIRSVASVLDNSLKPSDVPVTIDCSQGRMLLYKSGEIPPTSHWESCPIAFPPGQNIDLRTAVKTGAETVDAHLVWLDAAGKALEPVGDETPVTAAGTTPVCRRYPPAFRPEGTQTARVVLAATDNRPLDIQSVEVVSCGLSAGLPRILAFERKNEVYVTWWLDSRPTPIAPFDRCTIRVRCAPEQLAQPLYADLVDGAVRPAATVRRDGDWTILENLPISDYSFVLADRRTLQLASTPPLITDFTSPGDLSRQYVGDCFGRGRPEYWQRLGQAFGNSRTPLANAYRRAADWFGERLEPASTEIAVTDVPVIEYSTRTLNWSTSIVNAQTQHVDRYFSDLASREAPAQLHLLDDKRELPRIEKWADAPENAGKWYLADYQGTARLFIIVPKGQSVPKSCTLTYPHEVCRPILHTFRDPATGGNCLVLWSKPFGELPEFSGDVTLSGSADELPEQAVVLDLVTGRELGRVKATADDGASRKLAGIPISPDGIIVMDQALKEAGWKWQSSSLRSMKWLQWLWKGEVPDRN